MLGESSWWMRMTDWDFNLLEESVPWVNKEPRNKERLKNRFLKFVKAFRADKEISILDKC